MNLMRLKENNDAGLKMKGLFSQLSLSSTRTPVAQLSPLVPPEGSPSCLAPRLALLPLCSLFPRNPLPQEELCGWVPGDWQRPGQLLTRNRGKERMGASSPLLIPDHNPRQTSNSALGKLPLMCKTGSYVYTMGTIKTQAGILVENFYFPPMEA